jgi:ParB-like chromosome segregation protein Spo0J
MGKKLSDLGFTAQRRDYDLILPTDLSLVWHEKTKEFGPNDFLLSEHPDLHWAFDPSISEKVNEEHVALALTKGKDGCYIGIITTIGYRKVEIEGKLRLIVVFGRGRARMAREANRRILQAGGTEADFINVPARIRDVDEIGAALERDIENLHRKEVTPLMIARIAKYHVEKGTAQHLLFKACGVTTMQGVNNYIKLLEAPEPIQTMVDRGQLPMSEGIQVKKEEVPRLAAAVAEKGKLTAREAKEVRGLTPQSKMMARGQIEKWQESLKGRGPQARLVETVLSVVLGSGDMKEYPHLALPKRVTAE